MSANFFFFSDLYCLQPKVILIQHKESGEEASEAMLAFFTEVSRDGLDS